MNGEINVITKKKLKQINRRKRIVKARNMDRNNGILRFKHI
jgi:hypothetical protein